MEPLVWRNERELVHSFLALRKSVGFIAMGLPFVLWLVHGGGLRSVSQGYYTAGSALFVAGVCTIGVFLLFYRGFDRRDRVASFIAGAAALVVGLVPCGCGTAAGPVFLWGWGPDYTASAWPRVHLMTAGVLFGVLALFCLWLFPLSDEARHANPKKELRNLAYYTCGVVIVGCMLALLAHFVVVRWLGPDGVFWLETVMLEAFGISWAVKGAAIGFLNDRDAPLAVSEAGHQPTRRKIA